MIYCRAFVINYFKGLIIVMKKKYFIGILNHKIYSSPKITYLKLLILDLLEHPVFLLKDILMKLLHCGIGHLMFCLALKSTQALLIFGLLDAFLQKWPICVLFSLGKSNKINWQKYSKSLELQMNPHGLVLKSSLIIKTTLLVNTILFLYKKLSPNLIKKVSIY